MVLWRKGKKKEDEKKEDPIQPERGSSSMTGNLVPGFIKRKFTRQKQPDVPESEIKVGNSTSINQLLCRYSIRRIKNPDECVPGETKLFGRFYPTIRMPEVHGPSRDSIPNYDVQGIFQRLKETLLNIFKNLKELFTIPPHVIQALIQFLKALPLIILILLLIVLMNVIPVVVIASYRSENCVMGFYCWESLSEIGIFELINFESFVLLSSWYCLQLVLAGAPVGSLARYENNETGEHVCIRHNAVFAMYMSLSLIFLVLPIPYSTLLGVYNYFLSLCVSSLIYAFGFALTLHTNSFKSEHHSGDAKEGFEIFNFFVGKSQHPLIRGIDMKRFLSLRPGLIGLVFSDWLLLLHHLQTSDRLNCSLVALSVLHFCYVLQAMNLEVDFLATFRYSRDGFGYMQSWYSLVFIPFFYGLQTCYLTTSEFDNYLGTNIPNILLGCTLFYIGHYLLFVSIKQKTIFRRMTSHPKVSYLDRCSIGGAKINSSFLCSGFWGMTRNPNLLGELFMCLSFSVVCGIGNGSVHAVFLLQVTFLFCRSVRKEYAYCKEYGNCYKYYCSKTTAFIPK